MSGPRLPGPVCPLLREGDPRYSFLDQAALAADAGMAWLQFRAKRISDRERFETARRLQDLCAARGVLLVINDRPDVAAAVGAAGVHVGQDDLPPSEVRKLLPNLQVLGLSTHNLLQLETARAEPVTYLALGPVFGTRTKEHPDPAPPPQVRAAAIRQMNTPLVAIGGITVENAPALFREGFAGVAVCASVWDAPDPAATLRALSLFAMR